MNYFLPVGKEITYNQPTMQVDNHLRIYEWNGVDTNVGDDKTLTVMSHRFSDRLVRLDIDGLIVTVSARELMAAVANATNWC